MLVVHFIFHFTKGWTNTGNRLPKQHFAKGITKKAVIKVFDRTPWSDVASATFRYKGMDMRIPF